MVYMKIAIIGGHLAPALALIESLPKDTEVLYVGRKYALEGDSAFSLEYVTIKERKIPFEKIITGRLQRKLTFHTIPSLLKIPVGFFQAIFILRKFKPDAVLGFGGYLSVPVGISAKLLGIPLIIHEQALKPGLANKILAPFATKVCVSWQQTLKFFPKEKTILTGLPIRELKVESAKLKVSAGTPLIYITGGSQGSHLINTLVEAVIEKLLKDFFIIHQTGDSKEFGDFGRLTKIRETLPSKIRKKYRAERFIDPGLVGSILDKADLVVGRSGINTISELIFFQKPGLLIPLPFLKEQIKNAEFFKNLGIGEVLFQRDASPKRFLEKISEMKKMLSFYKSNAQKAKHLVKKDAAWAIIKVIKDAAAKKKN